MSSLCVLLLIGVEKYKHAYFYKVRLQLVYLGLEMIVYLSLPFYTIKGLYWILSLCAFHTIQTLDGFPLGIKGVHIKRKLHLLLISECQTCSTTCNPNHLKVVHSYHLCFYIIRRLLYCSSIYSVCVKEFYVGNARVKTKFQAFFNSGTSFTLLDDSIYKSLTSNVSYYIHFLFYCK